MSEQNKAAYRKSLSEVVRKGNYAVMSEVVTDDYLTHLPGEDFRGPKAAQEMIVMWRAAFPDLEITVDDQIAEGDKVATRWTAGGTHQGEFQGLKPTGKRITVSAIVYGRCEDGKVAEEWVMFDQMGLMQQLGRYRRKGSQSPLARLCLGRRAWSPRQSIPRSKEVAMARPS